jgi:hypothetical protein
MGFEVVPRSAFQSRLAEAVQMPDRRSKWEAEADLLTVARWRPALETETSDAEPPPPVPRRDPVQADVILLPIVGVLGGDRLALAEAVCALP